MVCDQAQCFGRWGLQLPSVTAEEVGRPRSAISALVHTAGPADIPSEPLTDPLLVIISSIDTASLVLAPRT